MLQLKKLKTILTITLALTLTLIILFSATLTTTITPAIVAATTTTTKNDATGQGANTNATLIVTGYNTTPGQADTSTGFDIEVPQGWGILNTTLTITNITAQDVTLKVGERDGNTGYESLGPNVYLAMAFQISTDIAKLYNVSVLVKIKGGATESEGTDATLTATEEGTSIVVAQYLSLNITNAVVNENIVVPGDRIIVNSHASYGGLSGEVWLNFTFNSVELKSTDTYNGTFFVVVYDSPANIDWKYVNDAASSDDGYAYKKDSSSSWTPMSVDFKMMVALDRWLVYPSEVGLSFNRTDIGSFVVEDIPGQKGNGTCTITGPTPLSEDGKVHFNASANWPGTVYFNVTQASSTLYRQVSAETSYSVAPGQPANWNITVNATGDQGFPEVGAGKFINVTLPSSWRNTTGGAVNSTGGESPYLTPAPSLLFKATNDTWTIQCEGPNVLSQLKVYALYRDWAPVEVDGAVVGDNLTVNGTLSGALTGTANLTVLNGSEVVYTNQMGFSGGRVSFLWSATSPGSYTLRMLVDCGLEVGLIEKSFSVSEQAPCSISAVLVEDVGVVKIRLQVSRSDTGFPVTGATVSVYYDNGSQVDAAVTDYDNGTYLVAFKPPSEGAYNVTLTVSGSRIAATSKTVSFYYMPTPPAPSSQDYALVALVLQSAQATQSSLLPIMGASLVAATAGGISGSRAYRRWRAPIRAMAAIENILVSHKETGIPLWSFDVLSLNVDEALVSGFISAMRSFAEEMRIGGFNTLETRLGTLVRIEGELVEAVCIVGQAGRLEVEWVRGRLRELVRLVEAEAGQALGEWKGGETKEFEEIFEYAFNRIFNAPQLLRIQERKRVKLMKERERIVRNLELLEEAPETDHEKELLKQRLAVIDDTLSRMNLTETAKTADTKTRKEIEEMRKEIDQLRKELEELKKRSDH